MSIHKKHRRYSVTIIMIILLIVAGGLIAYGASGLWKRYQVTHKPNVTITTSVIMHSTGTRVETKPPCDDTYQAASGAPRQIEIPSQNIQGCIQRVGTDQNGAIAVPDNVHLAGWYVNSVLPGEPGVSLIDGHVLGRYGDAIFKNLGLVNIGDTIRVQMADLSWREFEVEEVLDLSVEETEKIMLEQKEGIAHQLTLITCTGTFDSDAETYNRRIVVRAEFH